MSDSIVMKRSCERCPAVQEVPVSVEDIASGKIKLGGKELPKYSVLIDGKPVVSYRHLCSACETAVKNAIETISKTLEKKASARTKK